jgi:hypothetical protein
MSPYWREEDGISILPDGFLGFVINYAFVAAEPDSKLIDSYQIIHSANLDYLALAVRTKIRLTYSGSIIKTFFLPSYARSQMKKIYNRALSRVILLKEEIAGPAEFLSARTVAESIGREKHFLYTPIRGDINSLIGKVDFSYAKFKGGDAFLINADNIIYAMGATYDSGFWPVVLPRALNNQAKFLNLPLGAVPRFFSGLNFCAEGSKIA